MSTVRLKRITQKWGGIHNNSLRIGKVGVDEGLKYIRQECGRAHVVSVDSSMPYERIRHSPYCSKVGSTTLKKKRIRRNRPHV